MADEPLNTEVRGEPAECRAVGQWFGDMSRGVHQAGDALFRSRSESESLWQGQAGDAFRESVLPKAKDTDEISDRCSNLSTALMNFAGTLEAAQRLMADARDVAAKAGLDVTPTQINPPSTAPVAPDRDEPTPQARDQYFAAHNAQQNQIDAFRKASDIVDEARERESDAHRELGDVLREKSVLEEYGLFAGNALITVGAAEHTELKILENKAASYKNAINAVVGDTTSEMSFVDKSPTWELAGMQKALYDTEKKMGRVRAVSYVLGGPPAYANPGNYFEPNSEKITAAGKAGKLFPYLGTALTGISAVQHIREGKPAAKEFEKAGGGILASAGTGAAAGACIGGPVGAAVGAVGGAAVSYGIGAFVDWKGGPVEQFNRSIGIE